jgi:hypothetical protein
LKPSTEECTEGILEHLLKGPSILICGGLGGKEKIYVLTMH